MSMSMLLLFSGQVISSSLQLHGRSTLGFPVPHHLSEFAQVHVHWIGDAIQPSYPLLPSSPAFNLYQHQGLFWWVNSSHQVVKVLELQLQHQSFQSIQGWFPLRLTGLIYLLSKGLSGVFSNITVRKHQFFGTQPSLLSNSHICTEKAMAPHSSSLAWKIPWTEDPGRLQSMGLLKVGHEWATSLSLFTFTFHFHALEKEMATHSSILAWRIPGSGEPGGLMSMGSHRGGHDWSDLAEVATAAYLYMITGKTIALTIQTFVSKEMSLLFNTLFRFVIAFLPRNNHLLILWLQSPSAVILEPKNRKSVTASTFSPCICHEVMEPDAMILIF